MYKAVLFDLDGTLTDSGEGIKNSVKYAFEKFSIDWTKHDLDSFIGPPLVDEFMKVFNLDYARAMEMVNAFREYLVAKGIYENRVYDNVVDTLRALKENGVKIAVATSKPTEQAMTVLEHFDLSKYFDCVVGASLDGSFAKKGDIIGECLKRLGLNASDVIMVGDRIHDVIGASQNKIDCALVSYGYAKESELKDDRVKVVLDSIEQILKIVL